MAHLHRKVTLLVLGTFVLLGLALAPSAAGGMKMLTPGTGWVRHHNTLYWTADGGSQWSDITPVPPGVVRGVVRVGSVFFLDTQQGWAVISYPETIVPSNPETLNIQGRRYEIAHTVTSGQTWSFTPFTCPRLPEWEQVALAGPGGMYFLDSDHGWLVMLMTGSSNFAPGKLLATQDGGSTWNWVNSPGTIGTLLFTTAQDGWLAGGPGGRFLYATHDGTKTWEEVHVTPPLQVRPPFSSVFGGPPLFLDGQRGFVAVSHMGRKEAGSNLVVYSTTDGGATWQPAKVLPISPVGGEFPVSIVDSVLVVPHGPARGKVGVATVQITGKLTSSVVVSPITAVAMSFFDAGNGWVLSKQGRILATTDGGATWTDITPWQVYSPPPGAKTPAPKKPLTEVTPTAESR